MNACFGYDRSAQACRELSTVPFCCAPGGDTWFNTFPDPAAERVRTEAMHPVGRIGTTREIGGMCAFLCSPFARFITGTTFLVDGGRSALMQDK